MELGMPRKSNKACELCYLVVPNIFLQERLATLYFFSIKLPYGPVYVQNKLQIF